MGNQYEVLADEVKFEEVLAKGIFYADSFVNKNYLINLHRYPVLEADPDRDRIRLI